MEKLLYDWYLDYHVTKGNPVTARQIKQKALQFTSRDDFSASKGWLEKFRKKFDLDIAKESELKAWEKSKQEASGSKNC